eukprot:scaffold367_cov274-Ochromonas_danica.AAC.13
MTDSSSSARAVAKEDAALIQAVQAHEGGVIPKGSLTADLQSTVDNNQNLYPDEPPIKVEDIVIRHQPDDKETDEQLQSKATKEVEEVPSGSGISINQSEADKKRTNEIKEEYESKSEPYDDQPSQGPQSQSTVTLPDLFFGNLPTPLQREEQREPSTLMMDAVFSLPLWSSPKESDLTMYKAEEDRTSKLSIRDIPTISTSKLILPMAEAGVYSPPLTNESRSSRQSPGYDRLSRSRSAEGITTSALHIRSRLH